MPCSFGSLGCPGPYNEDSCDRCAAMEAEACLSTPPRTFNDRFAKPPVVKTCGGPFASAPAWRCPDCRNVGEPGQPGLRAWRSLQRRRTQKRTWLQSHKDIMVQPVYQALECVDITPGQIDYCYGRMNVDWCPWVKIGNLYTTVTTGNDAGWRLLIRDNLQCNDKGPRDINVFTGRHGNPEGTLTETDREIFTDKVPDANHLLQDILQKAVADGEYSALGYSRRPRIKLWDVGTTAGSTMTKTQQLAAECLRGHEIVIFAWCWSLLSFYKTTEAEAAEFIKWDSTQPYNKSITDIVKECYGWVSTLAASAHGKGAWRAEVMQKQREAEEKSKFLFPQYLSAQQVRDSKDSLMERVRQEIRPTHYH